MIRKHKKAISVVLGLSSFCTGAAIVMGQVVGGCCGARETPPTELWTWFVLGLQLLALWYVVTLHDK